MPDISPYDINSGRTFIPQCLADQNFRSRGVLYGRNGQLLWAVIDPTRFPVNVWKKTANNADSYGLTAIGLGSAGFSNGPMMERYTKGQVRRMIMKQMLFDGLNWGVVLAIVGFLFPLLGGPIVLGVGGLLGGGILGYYAGRKRALEAWKPYGTVHGEKHGIDDPGAGNGGYVYFGRGGDEFRTYEVGEGNPTGGFKELISGLIPLVRHFAPISATEGAATYDPEYAKLAQRAGLTGWGLVPLNVEPSSVQIPDGWGGTITVEELVFLRPQDLENIDVSSTTGNGSEMGGVIVVVGTDTNGPVAGILAGIGTRDAVAMDGSDSVMIGAAGEFFFGPPPEGKQLIQVYGFYAG